MSTAARTLLAIATAAVVLVLALLITHDTDGPTATRATFVDGFGRQCTQVTTGTAVALDCDPRPVESRVGSALEGLVQP